MENAEDSKSSAISPVEASRPASAQGPVGRPECFSSLFQEILVVIIATMAVGISSMTAGIVTVNSSFIGRDLAMSNPEITWLSGASSLASGSFLLLFARIADLFGRRRMFIGSLFMYSVFALAAGFAKSGIALDIVNGFMGLTSAAAVPPAQGMLAAIYEVPSRRKNAVFACFSAGNPLGFVIGLISGGIVSHIFDWRAAFWWLAIIYFFITIIAVYAVPKESTDKMKLSEESIRAFDIVGSLLAIAGTGLFSAALR
jgi:MFS family permease